MDMETKVFVWFVAILIAIAIPLIGFSMVNLETKTKKCMDAGGVVVKTTDGWKCIKADVLKIGKK